MTDQQAAPGWYPVEGGRRWWDGSAWTEHFQAEGGEMTSTPAEIAADGAGAPSPGFVDARPSKIKDAAGRIRSDEMDLPEGTVWSAVGEGLGGITTGRYSLTPEYLYFEKGTLRTAAQQVYTADIGNVDIKQSMTQKARGVYTVVVHVNGRVPVLMDDIPDGATAQRIINETSYKARLTRAHRSIEILMACATRRPTPRVKRLLTAGPRLASLPPHRPPVSHLLASLRLSRPSKQLLKRTSSTLSWSNSRRLTPSLSSRNWVACEMRAS